MQKLLATIVVAAGAALAPATARAQMMQHNMGMGERPPHEAGVDVNFAYSSLGSLVSGGSSTNRILISTPVDLRLGFTMNGPLNPEVRLGFRYNSKGSTVTSGTTTTTKSGYSFMPGVNLIYRLGAGTGEWHQYGPYLTAGAMLDFEGAAGSSTTQFGFNGGLGTRIQYEHGAIRPEAYVAYVLKNTSKGLPADLRVGLRAGLSLWH